MADNDQRFTPIDLSPKKAKPTRFGPEQFVVPKEKQGRFQTPPRKRLSMSDAFKLSYRGFYPVRPDAEGELGRPDVGPYLRPKEKPSWQKLLTPVEKPEREDKGFQPEAKTWVHPMVLKKLIRERVEANQEIDLEIFNAHVGTLAKLEGT